MIDVHHSENYKLSGAVVISREDAIVERYFDDLPC